MKNTLIGGGIAVVFLIVVALWPKHSNKSGHYAGEPHERLDSCWLPGLEVNHYNHLTAGPFFAYMRIVDSIKIDGEDKVVHYQDTTFVVRWADKVRDKTGKFKTDSMGNYIDTAYLVVLFSKYSIIGNLIPYTQREPPAPKFAPAKVK